MIHSFNRLELKYVIPSVIRDALFEDLRANVSPDPEGGSGVYQVTSLYYDTADLACFRAKLEGIKFRRKLRIRRYGTLGNDPDAAVMVEIKQRINRTTQKRRIELPLREAYSLCAGNLLREWPDQTHAAVADEVTFLALALSLRPTCVIGYIRRAFIGSRYEPGLRITFDHGLWSSVADAGLGGGAARHAFLSPDWVVMELKTDRAIPIWVSNLLARNNVALVRFSKYCTGLARLHRLGLASGTGAADATDDQGAPILRGAPHG